MQQQEKLQFYSQLFSKLAVENIANGDVIQLSSGNSNGQNDNRIDIFRRKGCPEYEHGNWNLTLEEDTIYLNFNGIKYEIISWENAVLTLKNKTEQLRLKLYKPV